jgi:hypothetical protein
MKPWFLCVNKKTNNQIIMKPYINVGKGNILYNSNYDFINNKETNDKFVCCFFRYNEEKKAENNSK